MSRRIFIKSHWGKGFARYPWFWWNLCRWPGAGFALLLLGLELAVIKTDTALLSSKDCDGGRQ